MENSNGDKFTSIMKLSRKICGFSTHFYLGRPIRGISGTETHVRSRQVNRIRSVLRFMVFTAVTMKNAVFWDVTPRGSCKNQRLA
jgi:hypothetical protein